ncbi:hypothetical protein DBT_0691 [Dissulfuribacter thermophilus]|uniref:Uncharacterized protein n=1 Tax=Dissulfuribacter thermophilus TaxID=1156395 RepID=A0A1B9F769_9BACT|nr:hypothetical protein [Dissulfuribacter thermophilus]OCC15766.1 hypothetical protein DBT_0691 [Dissulfuribacter thermophilus]
MAIHSIVFDRLGVLQKGEDIRGVILPLLFDQCNEPLYIIFKEAL